MSIKISSDPKILGVFLGYIIVRALPGESPSDIMKIIKNISARDFFKMYPDIKKKYFWGGKLWTQSYFVETIDNANEKVIRAYVQNQLRKMDKAEKTSKQLRLF